MGCGLAAPEQECEIARIVRVAAKPTHTRIHCGGSLRAATPRIGRATQPHAAAYDRFQSRFPENAQVKVTEDGWRLSSDVAERRSPEEQQALERLTSWMGAHMRSIRLPDLLIEVDNELDWSRHFIPPSRRRERSVQDICEVVASVMAYGCNIGPETMARVTNDVSYKAIRRLADWQFSEDKLRGALADLVNGISRCDAAEVWGHARTSSSAGQRYSLSQEDPEGHVQPSPGRLRAGVLHLRRRQLRALLQHPDRVHGTGRSLRSGWAPLPRVRDRS